MSSIEDALKNVDTKSNRRCSMSLWDNSAPVTTEEKESPPASNYEEVAARARALLINQGWCAFKCSNLGGDVIILTAGGDVKYPPGYPVYSEWELGVLCETEPLEMLMIHEIKKAGGSIIDCQEKEVVPA